MSMLVERRIESSSNPRDQQCPESSCSGSWTELSAQSWATCPVCQTEVLTSTIESSDLDEVPVRDIDTRPVSANEVVAKWIEDILSQDRPTQGPPNIEDNIAIFKRIVQRLVSQPKSPPSIRTSTLNPRVPPVQGPRAHSVGQLPSVYPLPRSNVFYNPDCSSYPQIENNFLYNPTGVYDYVLNFGEDPVDKSTSDSWSTVATIGRSSDQRRLRRELRKLQEEVSRDSRLHERAFGGADQRLDSPRAGDLGY
ncbi:hypothetical protein EDB80DRAFT_677214 [Ilyonectria destructans]|nr:hypothetical protein EDB80DRAFT_677214 [Ilyonectria destructans]